MVMNKLWKTTQNQLRVTVLGFHIYVNNRYIFKLCPGRETVRENTANTGTV
jgi:hypothetical protein